MRLLRSSCVSMLSSFLLGLMVQGLSLAQPVIPDEDKKAPEVALSAREKGVLDLINAERDKIGLAALKPNLTLCKIARSHTLNVIELNEMNHSLEGKAPWDRAKDAGYQGFVGENIAL